MCVFAAQILESSPYSRPLRMGTQVPQKARPGRISGIVYEWVLKSRTLAGVR